MTVASIYAPVTYLGDGVTVTFPFPFPFFEATDLRVSLIDIATSIVVTPPPILDGEEPNDYRVIPESLDEQTGEILTATVAFNAAPAAGLKVVIERDVAKLQPASLADDAPFPAKSVEAALDRAMLAAQDTEQGAGLAADIALSAAKAAQEDADAAAADAAEADADAAAARALLLSFEEKYLGPKDSDPLTDNQGHPLQVGAIYYNSLSHLMFVWDGTEWIGITAAAVLVPGSVTTPILADGSVTTVKLGDASVTTVKIGDGTITTAKIGDAQVVTQKIGDGAIVTSKIGDLSITTNKLGDGAVASIKLADGSVINRTLGAGAVNTVNIFDGAVLADQIGAGAVVAGKIAGGAVVAGTIAAGAVVAGTLAAGAVNAGNIIVNDIVVTGHLVANAATNFAYGAGPDMTSIPNDGNYHDLISVGITVEGSGPVIVTASVQIRNDDNSTHGIYFRIWGWGTNPGKDSRIWPRTSDTDGAFQLRQSDGQTVTISMTDTPGPGGAQYNLQWRKADSPNVKVFVPFVQVVEIKR